MASTPMDIDGPESSPANNATTLKITRTLGANSNTTGSVIEVIANFRPTKLFKREDVKEGRPQPHILSLDFDDPGELCMTSESDETIQIYNVREGRHDKSLLSKKYGVKLAKFTHTSSSIVYASTKTNDAIRYLATHDNSFIRYFEGHEATVTCLAMHPGTDNFISCSRDDTVRLWDINTKQWTGQLFLKTPYLAAWDPSGKIFAVASSSGGSVLLYDHRNFDKAPFSVFDVVTACASVDQHYTMQGWTKLEFSNDGKHILLGTRGSGHFVLDAFDGSLRAYLRKPEGGTKRAAAGESTSGNGASSDNPANLESSGDCCFSPDGQFVLSGSKKDLLGWDLRTITSEKKTLDPTFTLEDKREVAVLAYNPRFNHIATADQDLMFWLPDPHV